MDPFCYQMTIQSQGFSTKIPWVSPHIVVPSPTNRGQKCAVAAQLSFLLGDPLHLQTSLLSLHPLPFKNAPCHRGSSLDMRLDAQFFFPLVCRWCLYRLTAPLW